MTPKAIILMALAAVSSGQPKTLLQVEEEALKNNLSLLAGRYQISMSEADIITARLRPNPSLSLSGDVFPHPGDFSGKNYSASVGVPIELGGKRAARTELAESASTASARTFDDAIRMLLLAVRTTFYGALDAKYSLELASRNIESLDSIVALNKIRLQAKDISESELMRTEVSALNEHVQFESARAEFERAKIVLQESMGSKQLSTNFDISGDLTSLPDTTSPSLGEATRAALEHRPDLLAMRSQVAAAEANKKLQDALSAVDISAGGYYSTQQGEEFAGISLSVPLPLFSRNQGEIRKAESRFEQAKVQLSALEHQIEAEVRTAYDDFLARKSIVSTLGKDVIGKSASVRDIVEYSYRKGGTSILDLLDAQRTFNDTMKSYYDALASLHKSAYALRAAIGRED